MKKKLLILIMIFAIIVSGFSCKKQFTGEKAVDKLKKIEFYTCNATITIINKREKIDYDITQYFSLKDGGRLDLGEDRTFIFKGDKIFVNDKKNNCKYSTESNFDELFTYTFINEYIKLLYTNDEIKFYNKSINNEEYGVLMTLIPGKNHNLQNAELYLDLKTNLPKYLKIYNDKGEESVKVEYKDFKVMSKLEEEIFKVN